MRNARLDAWLRLTLAGGLGPRLTQRLVELFDDPEQIVHATPRQLQAVDGIGSTKAREIHRAIAEADVDSEWALIDKHGVGLVTIDDPGYPLLLKNIQDPPPVLYVRGSLERNDAVALGVVGSRKCTNYGREQAERLAAACGQAGLTIVSGGARGIDTAAHRGAMRGKARTIAVLGCGLAQCYPPENRELFDQIAECGAVVSELPMTAPPIAEHFPRRNRIISGLSLGVLVVEAAVRSGALITARLAAEDHNREVMALPGRVDSNASNGCHKIIREGWAALVTGVTDILDSLGETGQLLKGASEASDEPAASPATVDTAGMSDAQRMLFEAIGRDATPIDNVVRRTGLPVAQINADLTLFQLRGLIERTGGNAVRRRR